MKRKIKLTKYEKEIEAASERGEYVDSSPKMLKAIAAMLEARKKDAVLNIRINGNDLESLKQKAVKMGVKYQTFISEVLHRVAQS